MVRHLAIIMDGNRRWAKKRSLMPWRGHREGVNNVQMAAEFCIENHISVLSLYTFSLENFSNRSLDERNFLFDIIIEQAERVLTDLIKHEISIRFIGDRAYFPDKLIPAITKLEQSSAHGKKLVLNILFCYGGRQEILAAMQAALREHSADKLLSEQLSDDFFKHYLWMGSLPDPDIIVRTGGIKRLSNFLLFQAAYSEFFFLDDLWPDLKKDHLGAILNEFNQRQRNFGA